MDRRGRELAWAGAAVLVAAAIALFAAPLPPLLKAAEDEWWARGFEFLGLTFLFWMALGTLGFLRAKIAVGLDGISGEHQDQEGEALRGVREANLELAREVVGQQRTMEDLRQSLHALERQVQKLGEAGKAGGDGVDAVRALPPSEGEA